MTINQQPDALSLSLNIKDFKIASTDSVPFVLKKGTTELVAQNYEPGQDGFVTISVRDMVHAQLSLAIPPSASPYEQPNIAANFTAVIDGTEVTFRVLRAGVDKLADTAANFLTANWLTWQPQTKAVTYSSPEYLSYYAVATSVAKLKAYFTNEAGEVTSEQTITLHNLTAGKAYTLTTQYAAVSALLGNALPAFYDVWVEDGSGTRLTYIQRYYAGNMQSEQEDWVLFENSLGGIDCFRAYGATNFTGEHTHNLAEIDEVSQEYRVDTERKLDKNTGYLDKEQRRWLLDFFPSRGKYIYTAQALRTIVVTESNVTYTDKELPSNYTFTYKYADATALLNIARTATPTEVLTISVPDLGNFTVPPRLVEVARLPLTEGALFPVQSPYSEEWATTTAGAIFNFVKNLLGSSYEGGGGIGHTHGNLEVLQALSYAAGYLRYDGAKLKAGYADDIPEVIQKVITFLQGARYGTWSQGSSGAAIYQDVDGNWHFEADFMNIRKKITATEIEIMEASHIGGILNLTGAYMRCIKVEETADSYRCFMRLEDSDGNRVYNQWKVGDQAFVETFNLTRQADGKLGNHYLWRLVTAVGEDYIDLSKTIAGAGSDAPLAGDNIVLLGYQGTDDPNRQNAMILAGAGVGSPYLKQYTGINSFTLPKEEIRLKPGDNLLMGDLYTQDGQSVKTQLTVLGDKISAEVSSVRDDLAKDTSLLNNPNFNLMNYWQTDNEVKLLTASGKWIFVNNKLFGRKKAFAGVAYDGSRTALFIRNKYILQLNDNLISKPTFTQNGDNLYVPEYFYIKFYYRVKKAGTLAILFEGEDKTGWVPYNSISVVTALSESDTYQTFETGGQWNGTGNFKLSFTGEIYLYGVVLAKDRVASLEEKSAGWLTEADGVKIWAASEITMPDGTKVKASSLFNVTADGIFLKSDNIKLEGVVTANENFRIREDGSIETQNAKLSGYLYSKFIDVVSSDAILQPDNSYLLNTNLNLDVSHNNIKLPVSEEYMGARVLLMDSHFIVTRVPQPPTKIETEDGSYITSGLFDGSNFMYKGIIIDAGTVELTLKRLLTGYTESGDEIYEYRWVLINCSAKTLTPYN